MASENPRTRSVGAPCVAKEGDTVGRRGLSGSGQKRHDDDAEHAECNQRIRDRRQHEHPSGTLIFLKRNAFA